MGKTANPVDIYDFRPATGLTDQRLTVDGTTGGVKLTAYATPVTHCLVSVEDAQCRFTLDDSAPTSTNGHVLENGDTGLWPITWISAAKFIRTTSTSAVLHVSPLTKSGVP